MLLLVVILIKVWEEKKIYCIYIYIYIYIYIQYIYIFTNRALSIVCLEVSTDAPPFALEDKSGMYLLVYYTVVQILVITLEYVLQAATMFFERDLKLLYRFFESVALGKNVTIT